MKFHKGVDDGQVAKAASSPHSRVFASAETGPCRFSSRSPNSRNLYLRPGARLETVTSRRSPPTGTVWGCPCTSLYWTRKELKGPCSTVHERRTVSEVTAATSSSPRRGARGLSVVREAGTEQRRLWSMTGPWARVGGLLPGCEMIICSKLFLTASCVPGTAVGSLQIVHLIFTQPLK